ncbi:MAG: Arc family DNA-binding protein [Nitrospinae bacterium]|nr:Arc family DNA-binding protein [Nitrospinota bacterium]
MPQALIRNLDVSVLNRLKTRAAAHGRSLQAELKRILEQAAREPDRLTVEEFIAKTARLRRGAKSGVLRDSVGLIREDRMR